MAVVHQRLGASRVPGKNESIAGRQPAEWLAGSPSSWPVRHAACHSWGMPTQTPSQEPLLRTFGTLDEATAARNALAEAGLPPDTLEVRVIEDEAGPVEGNFLIGNGRSLEGRPSTGVLAGGEVPYGPNFSHTVARGGHLLMVKVRDQAQRELAHRVLQRLQAVDPAAAASAAATKG
jgi:hypothetical protein